MRKFTRRRAKHLLGGTFVLAAAVILCVVFSFGREATSKDTVPMLVGQSIAEAELFRSTGVYPWRFTLMLPDSHTTKRLKLVLQTPAGEQRPLFLRLPEDCRSEEITAILHFSDPSIGKAETIHLTLRSRSSAVRASHKNPFQGFSTISWSSLLEYRDNEKIRLLDLGQGPGGAVGSACLVIEEDPDARLTR